MVNLPAQALSTVAPIVIRSEPISRRFVLESLKQDDAFIFRVVYPPNLSPMAFRRLVLLIGDTIGPTIPLQFKVKISPIAITDEYKVIQAEINDFGWYPYSLEIAEKVFADLKTSLSGIKL